MHCDSAIDPPPDTPHRIYTLVRRRKRSIHPLSVLCMLVCVGVFCTVFSVCVSVCMMCFSLFSQAQTLHKRARDTLVQRRARWNAHCVVPPCRVPARCAQNSSFACVCVYVYVSLCALRKAKPRVVLTCWFARRQGVAPYVVLLIRLSGPLECSWAPPHSFVRLALSARTAHGPYSVSLSCLS